MLGIEPVRRASLHSEPLLLVAWLPWALRLAPSWRCKKIYLRTKVADLKIKYINGIVNQKEKFLVLRAVTS